MNGYFGFGVEGVSKVMNAGALFRTAHAFGAAFVFTVGTAYKADEGRLADTSKAVGNLPVYDWDTIDRMQLPKGCSLVGVELTDEAIPLPSFRHPRCAAYIVGPERGPRIFGVQLQDFTVWHLALLKFVARFSVEGSRVPQLDGKRRGLGYWLGKRFTGQCEPRYSRIIWISTSLVASLGAPSGKMWPGTIPLSFHLLDAGARYTCSRSVTSFCPT